MWKKRKLLIIDDNNMIRALLMSDFEDEYEVSEACSGAEGIDMAIKILPDIILLDVNMPDMTGIQVLRQLAGGTDTCKIPVIILTASEYNSAVKNETEKYPNLKGFMSKLVPLETIRENVKAALGK
ncbi:MAG: hypothetical protein A2X34_00630 [Elusimicrobia bacterium GWC2_51_8]|nr:MAG: hypothetical protein A2X33_06390 [Elusimicrobia bacterium GWA2_51_34]OGR58291.1 MAG: hypothetical protein A2X34_00630 [Elusimicrobia bacterium GWC2_51_8]OGR85066.1 MAG: hypothetical protein A2021_03685 [Elusimicrobia bacterium GWF2_52_66]HAF95005.1 hypothetical protein [Elusimicrobiota bacterium]HCE98789.1 hypothetical protein [Elusimicrobiota bacterium]